MERWLVHVTNEKVTHWSWTIRADLRPRRRTCRPSSASETGRRWGRGTCCRPRRLRRPAAPASRRLSGRCPQLVDTDFAEVGCSVGCKKPFVSDSIFVFELFFLFCGSRFRLGTDSPNFDSSRKKSLNKKAEKNHQTNLFLWQTSMRAGGTGSSGL